ncbi:MAG: 30S ribosomal protein S6 [Candidatus Komeilibacteria bacterium]|nr:30S ribosomal protein S6 [Candidatus Komeilibacteria bacterium]
MDKKRYELTYIISTAIPETEHGDITAKVENLLQKFEAEITERQDLGKRKMSYMIDKVRHGYYRVLEFNMMPEHVDSLQQDIKLMPQILRFLMVSSRQLSDKERAARRDAADRQAEEEKQEESGHSRSREDRPRPTPRRKVADTPPTPRKQPTEAPTKISLEDLDQKLDEILENKDLLK